MGSHCLRCTGSPFGVIKNVSELERGDGCTALHEIAHFKMVNLGGDI